MFTTRLKKLPFRLLAPLLALFTKCSGEVIISEFLAINSGAGITDEDNFPADWIEIHNPDTSAVNLSGYALTDDPADLQKWIFPNLTLQAGAYLRVFASGKDRKSDTDFLHTNFSLSSEGEYLALIRPDGGTIAAAPAPNYPPQILDISYGLGNGGPILETNILPLGAPLSYFVPFEEIGDNWKTVNFDDSSWTQSASAVGYGYDDKPPVAALISPNGNT